MHTKLLVLLLLIFGPGISIAQDTKPQTPSRQKEEEYYWIDYIDEEDERDQEDGPAEPIGGMEAFITWASSQLKYPSEAKKMNIQGLVFVKFVVEKDGSIADVEIVKGLQGGLSEEAIRVVSQAPAWKPAKLHGRAAWERKIIPILFELK